MLKNQAILTINKNAVAANFQRLQKEAGFDVKTGAVMKANAYGLGAVEIAPSLLAAGCRDFFVSSLEEGVSLRKAVKDARIMVLNGFYSSVGDDYVAHNLIPMLGSFIEIETYRTLSAKHNRKLDAFLSFNTRMNRLGLGSAETEKLVGDMSMLDGINVVGIMSHFACADEKGHPMNEEQFKVFEAIAKHFPNAEKSLCNSSGVFRDKKYHYQLTRPGMALYGLNPTPEQKNPMQPVVHLALPVMRTRLIYKGAKVGYNATWEAPQDSVIATVSAGYADGILRSLSNKGALYWNGHRCPIRGRISMDLTSVDITAIPENERPKPGDMLELLGEYQDADAVANDAGTIGYEILTALGARYKRVYI